MTTHPATNPSTTWQATLGRLQTEIPPRQFGDFLQPCVGHQWQGDDLVVAAPTSYAVAWLTLPLHLQMAEEALARTVGRTARILYQAMPHVVLAAPASEPAVETEPVPEADPDHCPDHPEEYLRWRTKWGSLKRMEQKWEDEIYFCPGNDGNCRWVYSMQLGTIIPAGPGKNTYEAALGAYKQKRSESSRR